MLGARRISKKQFYARGGFAAPRQYRKMRGRAWTYWEF
jgi:hypothetical protein